MPVKYAHSFSRGLTRSACIATVVALSAFGVAASASAATTHFGPLPGTPVAVGEKPVAVAVDDNLNSSGHKQVYVVNAQSNSLSVIDATTHQVTDTIMISSRTANNPSAIAINQRDDLIFVTEYDDDSVSIIDGKTHSLVTQGNQVGNKPDAIAWDSLNHRMYVADYGDGTMTVIDDQTAAQTPLSGTATYTIGTGGTTSRPEGIAYDPTTNKIIVAAQGDNKVFLLSALSGAESASAATFASPNAVAIDPGLGRAYVANYDDSTVSVIDSASGVILSSLITVGANPNALAVNRSNDAVYVANFNSPTLSVIDPATLRATSEGSVGAKPSGIAVDSGQSGEVYVSNQKDNTVSILGTTVSPTITSGAPTSATVGNGYTFPITATGTPSSITFSTTGDLPPGISVVSNADGSAAFLSGKPTQSGDFTFTLHASNGVDPEATAQYTLHVDEAAVTPTPIPTPTPTVPGHLPQVSG